jgi:hypothetical protein
MVKIKTEARGDGVGLEKLRSGGIHKEGGHY